MQLKMKQTDHQFSPLRSSNALFEGSSPLNCIYKSIGLDVPPFSRIASLNFLATDLLKIPFALNTEKASASILLEAVQRVFMERYLAIFVLFG